MPPTLPSSRSAFLLGSAFLALIATAANRVHAAPPPPSGGAASFTGGGSAFVPATATGWQFRPVQDIVVTDLGVHDAGAPGLSSFHNVGIFRTSGQPVVTAVVPGGFTAPLRGGARIVDIPDVTLEAGVNYYITMDNPGNDAVVLGDGAVQFDVRLEWTGSGNNVANSITSLWIPSSGPAGNLGPTFGIRGLTPAYNAVDVVGFGPHAFSTTATGWAFTAEADLLVTELGFYDWQQDGLAESHDVGLFEADGTLIVETTIPAGTGASLRNASRVMPIEPVRLEAGRSYYVTASGNTVDRFLSGDAALDFVPFIRWDGAGSNETDDIHSPWTTSGGTPGNHGPSFGIAWFDTEGPAPSAHTRFASFYGLPDHAVGWLFVPEADLRITELGLHDSVFDGLNDAHPVGVFRLDGTPVASATIPAGTAAPLRRGARVVPVEEFTLTEGVAYYIVAGNMGTDSVTRDPTEIGYDPRVKWIAQAEGSGNEITDPVTFTSEGWRGYHGPVFMISCDGTDYDATVTRLSDGSAFEDISSFGTVLEAVSGGDESGEVVFLPFPFTWYDERQDIATVSSKGFLTFGTTGAGSFQNGPFPDPSGPDAVLAPLWDDWIPGTAGEIRVHTRGVPGHRRFVVQWTDVEHRLVSTATATFQVTLFEGIDCVRFAYGERTLVSPTIGFEDAAGSVGRTLDLPPALGGWIICPSCDLPDLCPGDTNATGTVTFTDVLVVLSEWGATANCTPEGGIFAAADFDRDCDVDFTDLLTVLGAFGPCP